MAFVSDAGPCPGVSDPGQRLVDAALDEGLAVEVIPGPSAVTCALVASGLASEHFFFEGFLPRRKSAQVTRLRELALVPGTIVCYESPRRVAETLANVAEVFPARRVALVRELTKLHEECVRGMSAELAAEVAACGEVRGECVVVIAAPTPRSWRTAAAPHREAPPRLRRPSPRALPPASPRAPWPSGSPSPSRFPRLRSTTRSFNWGNGRSPLQVPDPLWCLGLSFAWPLSVASILGV